MNKTSPGLRAEKGNRGAPPGCFIRLFLLLPSGLMLLGLWGAGNAALGLGPLTLAAGFVGVAAAVCLPWTKGGKAAACSGMLLLLAASLIGRAALGQGLRAALSAGAAFWTKWQGYLHFGYAGGARTWQFEAFFGLLAGLCLGAAARKGWSWCFGALGAAGLIALGLGLLPGWPAAVMLAGAAMLLPWHQGADWRRMAWSAAFAAVLASVGFCVQLAISDGAVRAMSASARRTLHVWRYEAAKSALPEGNFEDLGSFSPTGEGALRVTMSQWTSLYLKGFTGSVYTGTGWKAAGEDLGETAAELTYRLQKDYFFSANQLAAANVSLGNTGQTVSVQRLGACGAWAYTPYGGENPTLDPRRLTGEGTAEPKESTWQGTLYPASQAYLVQAELAGGGDRAYLDGERAYRERVYAEDLRLSEDTLVLLERYFDLSCKGQTTTRIRQSLASQIASVLTYDEMTTAAGDGDFVTELLTGSRRGYSVHYATLTTLLLRACGVPARYAEGYLVTAEQAADMADGESLVLTEKNAHAWAEFYLDGVGWLPFDTTPAHVGELTYSLPQGGDLEGPSGAVTPPNPPDPSADQPQVDQRENIGEDKTSFGGLAVKLLALALLLLLLSAIGRALLLRGRLRKHLKALRQGIGRRAVAGLAAYAATVLACMGLKERNVPLTRRGEELSMLLGCQPEAAEQRIALAEEALFSSHAMTAEQHGEALAALDAVLAAWKKKRPWIKRVWDRWVTCRVL